MLIILFKVEYIFNFMTWSTLPHFTGSTLWASQKFVSGQPIPEYLYGIKHQEPHNHIGFAENGSTIFDVVRRIDTQAIFSGSSFVDLRYIGSTFVGSPY